jgi:hypothetical protein
LKIFNKNARTFLSRCNARAFFLVNHLCIFAGDCDLQVKLVRGEFWTHPEGVFKSVEELWDGEIA